MTISNINNSESGASVRSKINHAIGAVNGMMAGAYNPLDNHSSRDEDPSIATVTFGSKNAALTREVSIFDNLDKFHLNGYINLFQYSIGVRLGQVTVKSTGNVGSNNDQICACYSFVCPADRVGIEILTSRIFNVKVDGVFIDKSAYSSSGGGFTWMDLLFPSEKPSGRLIQIYTSVESSPIATVATAPIYDVTKPLLSDKRVAFVGDSFSAGTGSGTYAGLSWVPIVADAFGWHNFLPNAEGGTGFINDLGDTKYTFAERIPDLVTFGAEKVIVSGSINDNGNSDAAIEAAVTDYLTQLHAALPGVDVVVLGVPGRYTASTEANELAVKAGVESYNAANGTNIIFVPLQTRQSGGLVYGTGDVGSPTGDGNADVLMSSDGDHYAYDGYVYSTNHVIPEMVRQGVTY